MEGSKKSKRWILFLIGSVALVCVVIIVVLRSMSGGEKERSLASLSSGTENIAIEGVDAELDIPFLLSVVKSVPGVRSGTYDPRSHILSLTTTPDIFRRDDLARVVEHVGLGWYLEGEDGDRPYRVVRERLVKARQKRREFFGMSRDEIVFDKKDSLGKPKRNELVLPKNSTKAGRRTP